VLFGTVLLGGLLFKKPLLEMVFRFGVQQSPRKAGASSRCAGAVFLLFPGGAQRDRPGAPQTTDFWVSFKVFGVVPLTMLFGALQFPLLIEARRRKRRAAPDNKKS